MDASIITAVAALSGAAIGGLTSFLASLLAQRMQARSQWVAQERLRRQDLYKEFLEEATKCQAHALQNEQADIPALVVLYGKISRMHILSSPKVVESAEEIGRRILDTYVQPNKTPYELTELVARNSIYMFHDFSEACREELEALRG